MPNGKHVKYEHPEKCSLLYNEYVVYDTTRIQICYAAKGKVFSSQTNALGQISIFTTFTLMCKLKTIFRDLKTHNLLSYNAKQTPTLGRHKCEHSEKTLGKVKFIFDDLW